MKVALVSSAVPMVFGGYRFIVEWLEEALLEQGHSVEVVYLPSTDDPATLFDQMMAFRLLDLSDTADQVITFRPPAHVIPHPNKVAWFIHHARVYYDLWETPYSPVEPNPYWDTFRKRLIRADTAALSEARKLYTNSNVVGRRLQEFNGLSSETLYPPVHRPERFHSDTYGDEIVCICRLEHHKRQHLLIEAMKHTQTPVKLRLCGAETPYTKTLLKAAAKTKNVEIEARWISEEEKVERLASSLAAVYFPVDEDSYGYPTLEAAHARKGVIVASDGGGVTEFVRDGVEGYVIDPDPRVIADTFDRLWADRKLAERLGDAAHYRVSELGIDWTTVVRKLME
ncbi:glycosyltransferase family 4 protein [Seohaeicola saemankumensis]|uniref:Glycosyltransferase family 4 protein n=1 Tax=Seohaeicola saemankumensis TaxID=481181 RepID=A0ABW3TAN3_9RHOB